MSNKLNVTVSPHIRSVNSTTGIMLDVVIALIPALIAGIYFFGPRALYITAVCVLTCVLGELSFQLICKRAVTIHDLSAVVTGMLLAFNLPVSIPEWQAIVGSLVAIVVVKQLFGGIGYNFANPAIAARVMMLLSFSTTMTNWPLAKSVDDALVSEATPLAIIKGTGEGELPSLFHMMIGERAGCIGETCAIAIFIGFMYLLFRKVITWHTPVVFVGGVFLLSFFALDFSVRDALYQVLSGGLLIGAVFMATDYTTTPPTPFGKVVFALGCAVITVAVRLWGSNPEGVSFAILFMNILTPYISRMTKRKVFGGRKVK
ncbi:MAG: RnfABCDGE type electron transport complex subunit D [Ruminococcaceae bacterium]|nr:RnfABCDGE type electron transport complex subunit D [Oscillospiraceae bacterium]